MTVQLQCMGYLLCESVIQCASDLELISHGPLLEFHTPESSHDPSLAAQAKPRPQGPHTLFHMGYTHLVVKFRHIVLYRSSSSFFFFACFSTRTQTHTLHSQQSSEGQRKARKREGRRVEGRREKREKKVVYCIQAIHKLETRERGYKGQPPVGVTFAWFGLPLLPPNIAGILKLGHTLDFFRCTIFPRTFDKATLH